MVPTSGTEVTEYMAGVRKEIDGLDTGELRQLAETDELLLLDRQQLLEAIPQCPVHGPCMPHALDWIAKARKLMGAQVDSLQVTSRPESDEEYEALRALLRRVAELLERRKSGT